MNSKEAKKAKKGGKKGAAGAEAKPIFPKTIIQAQAKLFFFCLTPLISALLMEKRLARLSVKGDLPATAASKSNSKPQAREASTSTYAPKQAPATALLLA